MARPGGRLPQATTLLSDPVPYRTLLHTLDQWSDDVRRRHPGVLPCRPGCSACCHGPFDISALDAALVLAAVRALPPEHQAEVMAVAHDQVEEMAHLEPDWHEPWDIAALGEDRFDALCDAMEDEPCPLLDQEGQCRIYGDRPLVCRMMGIPMETEYDTLDNDCPIIDLHPAYAALAPQPFDLASFEQTERSLAAEINGPETTIAHLLVGSMKSEV